MLRSFRAVVLLAGFLCVAPPALAGEGLAKKIEEVIGGPAYRGSRWGILVVDDATGREVYARSPDGLFAPASVTKLYSCAAALVELGAGHRFETPVYVDGEVRGRSLRGDLILVAQGDPTLGGRTTPAGKLAYRNHDHIYAGWLSTRTELTDTDPLAGLNDLARQVRVSGVHEVLGDVRIDDRLYPPCQGTGSGPRLLTPIMVNDNLVDVIVTPGPAPGEPARVVLRPQTLFLQVDAQVETVAGDQEARVTVERVGDQRYVVRGQIPASCERLVRVCQVDDPAGFARALFIEALRRQGVRVRASALKLPAPGLPPRDSYDPADRVACYRSPPLAELIKVTLKVSHNLYASTLPLLLAVKAGKQTHAEGMQQQARVLTSLGLEVAALSLESGAGGGSGDRVTPRATVRLIQAMLGRPEGPLFRGALPVLGVDGTLADAVGPDSPARGKVWAKTGTYCDWDDLNGRLFVRSKALAGVMTTAQGRSLTFAIFVNDVPLPRGEEAPREGRVLGRLCEVLHQHAR